MKIIDISTIFLLEKEYERVFIKKDCKISNKVIEELLNNASEGFKDFNNRTFDVDTLIDNNYYVESKRKKIIDGVCYTLKIVCETCDIEEHNKIV